MVTLTNFVKVQDHGSSLEETGTEILIVTVFSHWMSRKPIEDRSLGSQRPSGVVRKDRHTTLDVLGRTDRRMTLW